MYFILLVFKCGIESPPRHSWEDAKVKTRDSRYPREPGLQMTGA